MCKHYTWTPTYCLEEITFRQLMYYWDLAVYSSQNKPFPEDVKRKRTELESMQKRTEEWLKHKHGN